ncbi:MAG: YfhO family protein [Lachnospiraceae bacterium]|nr:YfhO family protein [Lachnospiraceae bacterium]
MAVIFLAVLAVKGIWPFGANTIDYYDMGQTNAPLYYHIWDFLHGRGSLFYTPFLDGGQNLSMAGAIQWNISIFNLFYYLIPRSLCFKSLSLFTGLRLVFMAVNMCIFLGDRGTVLLSPFSGRQKDRPPVSFIIAMSVAYGLCGYVLTHYTITTYLDMAALFPLLMLSLFGVLQNRDDICIGKRPVIKRTAIYALCLGYTTALSYYLGFMNLIFILLVSGTYIFLIVPKEERKAVSSKLVIGTVTGLMISAFMLLPAALQMTTSSRFNSNLQGSPLGTIKDILWSIGADMYYIKGFAVFGCFLAMAFIITGLVRFRKERRINLFLCLFCFYPCALIIFESINLLWHMGTYYHYPIRCGYLIPFTLLTAGAYFAARYEGDKGDRGTVLLSPVSTSEPGDMDVAIPTEAEKRRQKDRPPVSRSLLRLMTGYIIFTTLAVILGVAVLRIYLGHGVWEIHDLFRAYLVFAAVMLLIYLAFIFFKRPDGVFIFLAVELCVGAYIGFGMPNFTDVFSSDPEQSGAYVQTSSALQQDMKIRESVTDRIKNPDTMLNANYGMVIRRATVGGWANTARRDQLEAAMAFGYNAHFMRILDSGGTLFSDALLHVTQTLTCRDDLYTDEAWEKTAQADGYTLFDNKYILPFIMLTDPSFSGAYDGDTDAREMTEEYYRAVYKGAVGKEAGSDEFAEWLDLKDLHIDGSKALYLHGGKGEEIKVNGKTIPVPTIGYPDNKTFPAGFNSNLLYLGLYEDEDVKIEGISKDAKVLSIDLKALEELCALCKKEIPSEYSGSAYKFTFSADRSGQALIPLTYDRGFMAYVNGRKVPVKNIDDLFMGIPVEKGENAILLQFVPKGYNIGIIITILGLIAAFIVLPFFDENLIGTVSKYLTAVCYALALTILYIIPIAAFVLHQILKRI